MTLAATIRERRKALGFTLDRLAELSGSSKSYIWELENKNPPRPSAEKLSKIAAALGTTVDDIMGEAVEGRMTPTDRVFFDRFLSLQPRDRERVRRIVDVMLDT